jgi:hypothetical protein
MDNNISVLIDGGKINVKRKSSKSPKKSPLSKDYKKFLKRSKENVKVKVDKVKVDKEKVKKVDGIKVDLKNVQIKNDSLNSKVLRINKINGKKIVKVVNNKDNNKSKNKFTKKSQEKRNKRNSKRKKIHRKITKTKHLSFKCTDKNVDIKKIIKEAQTKSNNEIKEILKKKGIDIKSNKNKLLKDLYLFTNCGNINIVRE